MFTTPTYTPTVTQTPTATATKTATPLPAFGANQKWRYYYYAGSTRIAVRVRTLTTSDLYFLLSDHLGSASKTIDNANDALHSELRYKAFGETRVTTGTQETTLTFTGQREQTEIGLHYYGARWYDSQLGRWAQPDTIVPVESDPQSWDRYSYGLNNPLRYTDPTGHKPCDETDKYGRCISIPDVPGVPTIPDAPLGGDQSTPVEVGMEWLTGTGPRHHEFRDEDKFTKLLAKHDHIEQIRERIRAQIRAHRIRNGEANYNLSGIQGVPKYIKDYSTLATGGLTGNLAVTYLGSYSLDYYIVDVDYLNNTVTIVFHVGNSSTLGSGTRPPVLGYTPFWTGSVEPLINNATKTGPMSKTTQDLWWTETLSLEK